METYSHAPADYQCPFCAFLRSPSSSGAASTETDIVFQNEYATAFIGLRQWPRNPGNTLIVPNQHFENIYELPVEWAAHVHELAKAVALAMKEAFQCQGVSLRQHNEPAGNQDVWHYHVHVTPRYPQDDFYTTYLTEGRVTPVEERAELSKKLQPCVRMSGESSLPRP